MVDTDGSGSLSMDEAKKIAFVRPYFPFYSVYCFIFSDQDHHGFGEATLEPFFAQADESEDDQLDAVEFASFRSVIRSRAVKNAGALLPELDEDGDGLISQQEAERRTRRDDDLSVRDTENLFAVADQDRSGFLDRVELAGWEKIK